MRRDPVGYGYDLASWPGTKPSTEVRKRKFNFSASNLVPGGLPERMLPVTAFTFIMSENAVTHVDQSVIYNVYFYSWLVLLACT